MHFDPEHYRKVMNSISYIASQSNSLKTMARDGRSYYDLSISLLAVFGMLNRLYPLFYFMLHDVIIDLTNPLLDHPVLDEETRLKVHEIRVSAGDMEIHRMALCIEELERIRKLLP